MNTFKTIDFMIRTAVTAGSAHLANAHLAATQVGQYLGRTISHMPISAAYVPFASTAAISVISDGIEHFIVNKFFAFNKTTDEKNSVNYNRPITKILGEVVVRVLVGGGLFAAGAALIGGAILPALATGAAVGSLVFVANKVMDVFKLSMILSLSLIACAIDKDKEIESHPLNNFNEKLRNSINLSTRSFLQYVLFDKKANSTSSV